MDTGDLGLSVLVTIETKKGYKLIDIEIHGQIKAKDLKLKFFITRS